MIANEFNTVELSECVPLPATLFEDIIVVSGNNKLRLGGYFVHISRVVIDGSQ